MAPAPLITSTEPIIIQHNIRYAGHAAPVASADDVEVFVAALVNAGPKTCAHAFRLAGAAEGCADGGDVGVGAKLLHLLRQWDVENVAVAVTRDDSRALVGGDPRGTPSGSRRRRGPPSECWPEDRADDGDGPRRRRHRAALQARPRRRRGLKRLVKVPAVPGTFQSIDADTSSLRESAATHGTTQAEKHRSEDRADTK